MAQLFSNPEHQTFFDRNGYLVVDMLNQDEVKELLDYYHHLNNDHIGEYGFHVSMDNKSNEFVTGVINKLESVILPRAKQYFVPCKMFTASYVVKEPKMNSFVPPHQDWSFTDDRNFNSVTVWTTLVDTDINNGAMAVLSGSNNWFNLPRASPSPGYITPFQAHGMDLFPYMKLLPMKAGQALIFENKTLHASPPNNSTAPRIAAGIGITQAEAPLLHYYVIPGSEPQELQSYAVDREFFFKYNNKRLLEMQKNGQFPEGYPLGEKVLNNPKVLSKEELETLAIQAGNTKDAQLDQYLQQFYQFMAARNNTQSTQTDETKTPTENKSILGKIKSAIGRLVGA